MSTTLFDKYGMHVVRKIEDGPCFLLTVISSMKLLVL
jgi:hypothetical protein